MTRLDDRRDVSQSVVRKQRYRPGHPTDQGKDGNGHPPVEILQQSVRDRGRIGKPAREKETFRAFRAFLFETSKSPGKSALLRQGSFVKLVS
jgi:hypothetical protein